MPWLRIDDTFVHHPKFEGWPPARRWAWMELMSYCARYSTGGRIPNDLSILPRSVSESLLNHAEIAGWIDRDSSGDRWVHDWPKYNPADPTKAQRQAKWRAKRNGRVDTNVDTEISTPTSTEPSTSRVGARARPVPYPSPKDLASLEGDLDHSEQTTETIELDNLEDHAIAELARLQHAAAKGT